MRTNLKRRLFQLYGRFILLVSLLVLGVSFAAGAPLRPVADMPGSAAPEAGPMRLEMGSAPASGAVSRAPVRRSLGEGGSRLTLACQIDFPFSAFLRRDRSARGAPNRSRGGCAPPKSNCIDTASAAGSFRVGVVAQGRGLFLKNCAHCHADDATGDEGPDLRGLKRSDDWIARRIRNGVKGEMTAFGEKFSQTDIEALIAYLRTLK